MRQRRLREQLEAAYGALLSENPFSVPPPEKIHPLRWKAMIKSAKEDYENLTKKVYYTSQISRV